MLRKLIAGLCLFALLACPADARRIWLLLAGNSGGATSYLGQVATGGAFPDTTNTGPNLNTMSRSAHIARDNISSLKVAFANWSVLAGSGQEVTAGGTAQLTASIEYPAGTFTQLKFSGVALNVMADGATVFSDTTAIAIPNGAMFWVRAWYNGAVVGLFKSFRNPAIESLAFGASVADQTMSGTVVDGGFSAMYRPVAILGQTKKPSIFVVGDSRANGLNDLYTGNGVDIGDVARSVGPSFGYINGGANGNKLVNWRSGDTRRTALMQFTTDVMMEIGINDLITGGLTAAQLEAQYASFLTEIPANLKVHLQTFEPVSQSTFSVTSLTSVGTLVTATSPGAQFLSNGLSVFINGATPSAYNGTFTISNVIVAGASSTFQYTAGSVPGSPATGTLTCSDNFATLGNQTAITPERITFNNWVRGSPAGYVGFFEVADTVESARDSGKWMAPPARSVDGIHANPSGYLLTPAANAIPPSAFHRP